MLWSLEDQTRLSCGKVVLAYNCKPNYNCYEWSGVEWSGCGDDVWSLTNSGLELNGTISFILNLPTLCRLRTSLHKRFSLVLERSSSQWSHRRRQRRLPHRKTDLTVLRIPSIKGSGRCASTDLKMACPLAALIQVLSHISKCLGLQSIMYFEFVNFVTLDVWQIDCIRAMRTTQTIEYDDRIVINPISTDMKYVRDRLNNPQLEFSTCICNIMKSHHACVTHPKARCHVHYLRRDIRQTATCLDNSLLPRRSTLARFSAFTFSSVKTRGSDGTSYSSGSLLSSESRLSVRSVDTWNSGASLFSAPARNAL